MISVGPTNTPVLTATFSGMYAFCAVISGSGDPGSALLAINGNEAPKTNSGASQMGWLCYLNSSDQVTYTGPSAQLSGVRLGDEL